MGRNFGPLGSLLTDAPPDVAEAVVDALLDELASRWADTGIPFTAAISLVSARPA